MTILWQLYDVESFLTRALCTATLALSLKARPPSGDGVAWYSQVPRLPLEKLDGEAVRVRDYLFQPLFPSMPVSVSFPAAFLFKGYRGTFC